MNKLRLSEETEGTKAQIWKNREADGAVKGYGAEWCGRVNVSIVVGTRFTRVKFRPQPFRLTRLPRAPRDRMLVASEFHTFDTNAY